MNSKVVIQYRNIHTYIRIFTLHFLTLSPEQFPVSALPLQSRGARPLWSGVCLCATVQRSPSSCCPPEFQHSRMMFSELSYIKKEKNVQVKSLKHRLTLHLSTTQHSGVTSQLKYSIKWGPGTNVAGKMMTIGQIMKTRFCENFHRAVNLINESSSLLSKNSKFAGFSIFCVSYCQLLYFLFCFKCWRKRLSLWE